MPKENNKVIKHNNREKSIKAAFVLYAGLESLLEKINTCINNPKNVSTSKINLPTACSYWLFFYSSFDLTKNKLDYYTGKDCMKKFCKDLKEQAIKIINYEKNEMIDFWRKPIM